MNLPPRVDAIVRTLYDQNKPLANGSEDDRRTLTRMMAEQTCFELGPAWGTKATSSQAPQSKDAIAYKLSATAMDIWDWQNGSTRQPQTKPNMPPDYPGVTGQYFIQVSPVDHLGGGATPPGPTPPANDELQKQIDALAARVQMLEDQGTPVPYKVGLRSVQSNLGKDSNKVVSVWDAGGAAVANRDNVGIGEEFILEVKEWREVE